MNACLFVFFLFISILVFGTSAPSWTDAEVAFSIPIDSSATSDEKTAVAFADFPLYFVENCGRFDSQVSFFVEGADKTIFFTPSGLTWVLRLQNKTKGHGEGIVSKASLATTDKSVASLTSECRRWVL
jgi:hypothetical protein